jgi:hypothetical protein
MLTMQEVCHPSPGQRCSLAHRPISSFCRSRKRQLRLAAVPEGPVSAKSDDRDTSPPPLSSADALVAAEFAHGPQRSIHTEAEQQLHIQQELAAAGHGDSRAMQPAALSSMDGLSAAAVAAANEETSRVNRVDIYKAIAISGITCVLAGILDHDWVESHLVSFRASGGHIAAQQCCRLIPLCTAAWVTTYLKAFEDSRQQSVVLLGMPLTKFAVLIHIVCAGASLLCAVCLLHQPYDQYYLVVLYPCCIGPPEHYITMQCAVCLPQHPFPSPKLQYAVCLLHKR